MTRAVALVSAIAVLVMGLMSAEASSTKSGSAAKHVTETFEVDKTHASVGFSIAHLVISKVRGQFTDFTASLEVDGDHLHSAEATIQAKSIDTGNKDRDKHLQAADFLDVKQFPVITFKSTRIRGNTLIGNLTMHGVTKPVTLTYSLKGPIKDPWGNTKVGLEAKGTINRQDFGLTWSKALETGGLVVGNDVDLVIDFEAAKK